MSKQPSPRLDQLRAMREAQFANSQARQRETEKAAPPLAAKPAAPARAKPAAETAKKPKKAKAKKKAAK